MLMIKKFMFGPFQVNTYLIWDEITYECAVIDPGCYIELEEKNLEKFISSNNLKVKYLLCTHCHIDHIIGCAFIKNTYNPLFLVPEHDLPLLHDAQNQASAFNLKLKTPPPHDNLITEDLVLYLGDKKMNFIYTPGHTAGEYCIYLKDDAICVTGDVLFKGGIGRTDLWGGNYDTLIDSITIKLFALPDNVIIYPGHGENSKIGTEKNENPFLKLR
jgi:glyoxylase-like metal-dependent hydrolase (beta-lactamase superfamily II)